MVVAVYRSTGRSRNVSSCARIQMVFSVTSFMIPGSVRVFLDTWPIRLLGVPNFNIM